MFLPKKYYVFFLSAITFILTVCCSAASTWSSPVLPKLHSTNPSINPLGRRISSDEESWIGSILTVGAIIGPFPFGAIARMFGRKVALLFASIISFTGYAILAFATTVEWFYCGRILNGISLAGANILLPIYLSEISQKTNRGKIFSFLAFFNGLGHIVSQVLGPYTSIFVFNVILSVIALCFLCLFVIFGIETPYYLVVKGKVEDAKLLLIKLREDAEEAALELLDTIELTKQESNRGTLCDLVKERSYLRALFLSLILIIGLKFTGTIPLGLYTEQIFIDAGVTVISPEICTILLGVTASLGNLSSAFLIESFGRRHLLITSCFGIIITNLAMGTCFYLKNHGSGEMSWLAIVALILFQAALGIGLLPIAWPAAAELFPTNIKPVAAALVNTLGWICSFLVAKFFMNLNNIWGESGTFWFFATCCLVTFCLIVCFVPETKGKSFLEIQELLNGKLIVFSGVSYPSRQNEK